MSLRCKECGESFPKTHAFDMWEVRRQHFVPADPEGLTVNAHLQDAGVFCSRKCVAEYLKVSDHSGVFDLGPRKT